MEVLITIWNDPPPPQGQFLQFQLPIGKRILIKVTLSVMRITLSKIKKSLYTIDSTEPDINKNDKTCFLENLAKMVILENNKNEKFICQNCNWKCFIFYPLPRDRKP